MVLTESKRPRNVDAPRAAAILYGDWGTSKAYVVGLAFAVAGYSSFWLIAAMCLLTALVGVNYITVCKCYPDGGGVYAAVRHRSEIISIVGAFLLIADYIVTASISAFSAFQYLRLPHPALCAAGAIVFIGALNWYGPRHTGGLAVLVSLPTAIVVVLLSLLCLPHLGEAAHNLKPLTGGFLQNWSGFVGIVLALSGVEAIAGATGVMKLDPGATDDRPRVIHTSTPALLWVMVEVCFFTALLAFAMHALPGLQQVPATDGSGNDVNAPEAEGVRDYMLRYMGEVFAGNAFGPIAGTIASWTISIVFGVLLLSAVNTAIGGLIAMMFIMSRDRELPDRFQKLNGYGVPVLGLLLSTLVPATLVILVSDLNGLADLYAVGVVGAIATNLGATSTDKKLPIGKPERGLMFVTFLVMVAIELSLFVDKPKARVFAVGILAIGLMLRALAREKALRGAFLVTLTVVVALTLDSIFVLRDLKPVILVVTVLAFVLIIRGIYGEQAIKRQLATGKNDLPVPPPLEAGLGGLASNSPLGRSLEELTGTPMLCAVRGIGRTLDFALEEAREAKRPLYLLFVREQILITSEDTRRRWQEDDEAREIFLHAKEKAGDLTILPCYAVSDSPADTIVDITATVGASRLVLGAPKRSGLVHLLRGNIIQQVSSLLPEDIHLLVYA
ncbi:MAG: amino acid permease [Verrucomicrobia bacterium]|nr:amino acid permease [Verrucomicrobiota bacterium]